MKKEIKIIPLAEKIVDKQKRMVAVCYIDDIEEANQNLKEELKEKFEKWRVTRRWDDLSIHDFQEFQEEIDKSFEKCIGKIK